MTAPLQKRNRLLQILLSLAVLSCTSPVIVSPWEVYDGAFHPAGWKNASGRRETEIFRDCASSLEKGSFSLTCQKGGWVSPAGWIVKEADWTDLDHNGVAEVTLLVYRPFAPWPIDRVLPNGGYINSHQDSNGYSSHIILIGWKGDHWGELWAGSALARPVRSFLADDVDHDGRQELIVREGSYDDRDAQSASSVAVWKWNSFGFDLISRLQKQVTLDVPVQIKGEQRSLILIQ